jgi:23S rRNA (adenine2503-C2)-methyltransferase
MVDFFVSIEEKPFRAVQVLKWIHQQGVAHFDEMTNLAKPLREKLKAVAEIRAPDVVQQLDSIDGTRKFLFKVDDDNIVEAVFIPENNRGTLCVSSQIGCSLDCSFCATGKQGFNRNLTSAEIIAQVWVAIGSFGWPQQTGSRAITNVVMMGMGEPLMNFDNVVAAMTLMMDDNAYGLSKRRVTLSTAGVVPMLDKLAEKADVSLAISLHAPNDELRNKLVPINRKYPIAVLLDAAERYIRTFPNTRRKITIEYTLIDQVNDRPEHAHELSRLLSALPVKINLIPFNPYKLVNYKRVSDQALRCFQDILIKAGFIATIRTTRGEDIGAACGQLAGEVKDRTRRSIRYQEGVALEPVRLLTCS